MYNKVYIIQNVSAIKELNHMLQFKDVLIEMRDAAYKITPENMADKFNIKINPLFVSLDVVIPGGHLLQILWNKNTNTFIRFTRMHQLSLCGLCGNFNSDMGDDFITRSQYLASNALEFANTWKEDPLCQDATEVIHPCDLNPYRLAWAEKQCLIIHSNVFKPCHNLVYRVPYYESCVQTTCGCDIFGDCDCLCGAIAVYAKACLDAGVCINWRILDFCPVYCDYYNTHPTKNNNSDFTENGDYPSHYQPCSCPDNLWAFPKNNIEGCYRCAMNEYYDDHLQACVSCDLEILKHESVKSSSGVKCTTIAFNFPELRKREIGQGFSLLSTTPGGKLHMLNEVSSLAAVK
ncbi:mucin-6-like [Scyliorhinus torazame]|uniref:mucin-6-like n=1 Tax=Scyliorhinus torazame TaxID=75743 RepID=UPI003B5CFFF3